MFAYICVNLSMSLKRASGTAAGSWHCFHGASADSRSARLQPGSEAIVSRSLTFMLFLRVLVPLGAKLALVMFQRLKTDMLCGANRGPKVLKLTNYSIQDSSFCKSSNTSLKMMNSRVANRAQHRTLACLRCDQSTRSHRADNV